MYTAAARAFSDWFVQMFEVAFSRRMCCSRVLSVNTYPRVPALSTVSPAIRPLDLRIVLPAEREEAEVGTAEGQ